MREMIMSEPYRPVTNERAQKRQWIPCLLTPHSLSRQNVIRDSIVMARVLFGINRVIHPLLVLRVLFECLKIISVLEM